MQYLQSSLIKKEYIFTFLDGEGEWFGDGGNEVEPCSPWWGGAKVDTEPVLLIPPAMLASRAPMLPLGPNVPESLTLPLDAFPHSFGIPLLLESVRGLQSLSMQSTLSFSPSSLSVPSRKIFKKNAEKNI